MLTLVTVAALVAVTVANSDSDPYSLIPSRTRFSQQCAGYCKAGTKFNLRSGYTYIYNYEGTTATEVAGASNDSSQIKITAKALITVLDSQCDLVLQLQEVQLYDSGNEGLVKAERQKEFAATLQASPLRFSFQDGRIDQLCPSADESILALNLKRGLLSAFQNTMVDLAKGAHLYERDVSGSCETSYSVRQSMWSDVKVLRRKDLQSCSGRGYHTLGLSSTFSDKPKSVPIVKSEQYCEQTIDMVEDIFLRDAKCTETHVLAPFSNGQSGIRTTSTLSLTLDKIVGAEPISSDLFVNTRTSLQFDFSSLSTEQTAVEEDVWNTLKQLTKGSSQGVGKEVPQLFDQLISQLSNLDDQQLVKLFDQVREQRLRQFLMDALPLVGTAGSVSAIYQIYQAQEISRDELDSWLTALAFHKKPSLDLIRTLNIQLST